MIIVVWRGAFVNSCVAVLHAVDFHAIFDIDIKNSYIERKSYKSVYIRKLCKPIFDIRSHFFYIEENLRKSFDIEFLILHIETIVLCKSIM